MKQHNSTEIYDHPAKYMTSAGLFWYVGIDIIPLRDTSGD
jgi:hypothetical protein